MRVLHVSTWKTRCGIANYAETLADQLSRHGIVSEAFPISPHDMRTMVASDVALLVRSIGERAQAFDLVHLQHEFSFYSSPTTSSSIRNFGRILAMLKRVGRPAAVTFHTDPDYSGSLPTSRRALRGLVLGHRWRWSVAPHFRRRRGVAQALTHTMRGHERS